jgi:hypothetical protein
MGRFSERRASGLRLHGGGLAFGHGLNKLGKVVLAEFRFLPQERFIKGSLRPVGRFRIQLHLTATGDQFSRVAIARSNVACTLLA